MTDLLLLRPIVIGWLLLVAILAAAAECNPEVEAQPPTEGEVVIGEIEVGEHPDTFLRLAQLCVHESGWSSPADCAAIYRVLRSIRREDELLVETMLRAAPRLFGVREPRSPEAAFRHLWVRGLRADGGQPAVWPVDDHGPWAPRYRERWTEMLRFTAKLLAGEARDACERPPIAWGYAGDLEFLARRNARLRAAGRPALVVIDCGPTRNLFFAPEVAGAGS